MEHEELDFALAVWLIRFKYAYRLSESFEDIIENYVLYKPKPKIQGKNLQTLLKRYGINYEEEFKQFKVHVKDKFLKNVYTLRELKGLFQILKILIKTDSSSRSLYLTRAISVVFKNVPLMTLENMTVSSNSRSPLGWNVIFQTLDECILSIPMHEVKWNKFLDYKLEAVILMYKKAIENVNHEKISLRRISDRIILNIGKIITYAKADYAFDKFQPDYTKTINTILKQTFNTHYIQWNNSSVDYDKFIDCMKQTRPGLVRYCVLSFLLILKNIPAKFINKKYLLTFLIVFEDPGVLCQYQKIDWLT
ncbi:Piso0_000512 [Millerozyma farinosa CBS 7064]|uniref:Piso0_000512 protein n=1 Tax=Pichia sorbitophila (strain ATCC MYA-4447 / BCRC 22081 / CBS 7064 / NBRC 10061 / NRRL Y-12695) TaxID=559304 RepID=G8YVM6_PICSO|nr:Piso0_000512 [Millerozyma farinosa CBS 7064]CCE73470.1 Piso0_000512 [Millerozyma farinosa CBS 7064]